MSNGSVKQAEKEHDILAAEIKASHHDDHAISHEEYHILLNAENDRFDAEVVDILVGA